MYDSLITLTDLVTNYWSMGLREPRLTAGDGRLPGRRRLVRVQVGRPYQFERFAEAVGLPPMADRRAPGNRGRLARAPRDRIRPGVEAWAADKTKLEAASALTEAGVAAGPCNAAPDVIADPQVARRNMLVEHPRVDGVDEPVLVPGNPIKLSAVADGPDRRVPWLGEHTAEVLSEVLGLSDAELDGLVADGVVSAPLD